MRELLTQDDLLSIVIPALQIKAKKVAGGGKDLTIDENHEHVKFQLSQHYNIPMKDPIWETYTLEDLYYEFFLVHEALLLKYPKTEEEKQKEAINIIQENSEELVKGLFEDLDPSGKKAKAAPLFTPEEAEAWNKNFGDKWV